MLIRPISRNDLPALVELARHAGVGVTTLQPDPERMEQRIERSLQSFSGEAEPAVANHLLVLEDETRRLIGGTSAVAAAVGLEEPWYNYRVGKSVYGSREIAVYRQLESLYLTNDLTGSSELCSLYLTPEFRGGGNGMLLSKSRFLYMAEFPQRFAAQVIAELRGVSDPQGRSPFWEGLGRHFFRMDFSRADYLSGVGNKSFIAELMPQHPVYTAFLPAEAQAVIGQVHEATRPARAMLEAEGFSYQGYIDIFDAGPAVSAPLAGIRAIRDSQVLQVESGAASSVGESWLVSNRQAQDFRAVLTIAAPVDGRIVLDDATRARLNVAAGDTVRAVSMRP